MSQITSLPRFKKYLLGSVTSLCIANISPSVADEFLESNSIGHYEGMYFNFWKDSGSTTMTLVEPGHSQASWQSDTNNWLGGFGWEDGRSRTIHYSGEFTPNIGTNAYLSLFGWSRDPFAEYYVIESYGSYNPASAATYYGSYESDGVLYDAFFYRNFSISIADIDRVTYYSIRKQKLPFGYVEGTISIDNHFKVWQKMGLELGDHAFTIMATEGYLGSGTSDIWVTESSLGCGLDGTTPICCNTNNGRPGELSQLMDGTQCIITDTTLGVHSSNADNVIAAINVGGLLAAQQHEGIWYSPNGFIQGGKSRGSRDNLPLNEESKSLYSTAQMGDLQIAIPLEAEQAVSIQLGFNEFSKNAVGERQFNVFAEDLLVLENVDLVELAGTLTPWLSDTILVHVTDGELNIAVEGVIDDATLSSLLVLKVDETQNDSTDGSATKAGYLDLANLILLLSCLISMPKSKKARLTC